jgi:hypothetical protein
MFCHDSCVEDYHKLTQTQFLIQSPLGNLTFVLTKTSPCLIKLAITLPPLDVRHSEYFHGGGGWIMQGRLENLRGQGKIFSAGPMSHDIIIFKVDTSQSPN